LFHKVVFSNDVRLSYAVGRVRALENLMLPKGEFERFIDMNDGQLQKILEEHRYSFNVGEDIINDQVRNYNTISRFLKPVKEYRNITWLVYLQNDFRNIKNYLKKRILKRSGQDDAHSLQFADGNFKEEDIIRIVEKGKHELIDPDHKEIITESFKKIMADQDGIWIEHYLDQLYCELFYDELIRLQNNFLIFYYRNYRDLLNIENLIRMKVMKRDINDYKKVFFKNSSLRWIDMKEVFNKKIDELPEQFKVKPYYPVIKEGIDQWNGRRNFNQFELRKDNFLLEILKLSKVAGFGIEPLMGYLWGKDMEHKNLRIIIQGRKRALKQERIKELLRETYV